MSFVTDNRFIKINQLVKDKCIRLIDIFFSCLSSNEGLSINTLYFVLLLLLLQNLYSAQIQATLLMCLI